MSNVNKRVKSQILSAAEWLAEGKTLTPLDALNLFGSMRLSSIIHELRKYGAIIETETVKNQNGSLHAKYYVKSENIGALINSMIFLKHPSVQVRSYV